MQSATSILKKIKEYRNFIQLLNKKMNNKLVSVEGKIHQGIFFHFKNGFKVIVISEEYKRPAKVKDVLMIYDKDFILLKSFLKNELTPIQEDGSLYLHNVLHPFLKSQDSKKMALINWRKLYYYEPKHLLNSHFKLNLSPDKEFFLLGNDELSARFKESKFAIEIPKTGLLVQIQDTSALLFTKDNKRYIDLYSGFGYLSKTHLYVGNNLISYKKDKKGSTVIYNSKTKKSYKVKPVLNKNANLKKAPKIKYKKAHEQYFILKKKNGAFFFEDKDGLIEINHPDLLIQIL